MSTTIFYAFLCMILGYTIGTLNPAFLIAHLKGFDIREKGSGNAGASNALITMGTAAGVFSALFDIGKAWLAVTLARHFFPALTYAAEVAGVYTILGHIFPLTMGFRGGKGLASLGGVVLAFNGKVFCMLFLAELVLALILDYICVVPITASVIFPVIYYFITGQIFGTVLYAFLAPLYLYKHLENLRRIRAGTEAKLSYLWSKDEEVLRMKREARGK